MGKVFNTITDEVRAFIAEQQMFFVATAPLAEDGHVNVSPKGLDTFRILSSHQVAYLDLTGSGNETSAHIHENGRITFMFCAFKGAANIVRLYGTGRTVLPEHAEWNALAQQFELVRGTRQIIVAEIDRVSTSCGYAVPLYDYKEQRETLIKYWKPEAKDIEGYQVEKNSASIDGLGTPIGERSIQP
jgi:Pyridoxamine 5'-phosphate oxidase